MARNALIGFRRGTAAAWTSANPTLAAGEPGFETNTGKVKVGDGSTAWNSLAYIAGSGGAPSGAAGGVLSGTYPDPGFAVDMATQAELDAVAGAAQPLDADLTAIAGLDSATAGAISSDGAGWIKKTYTQFKTALSLVKGDVGLGNVDNTADTSKPVSTAQQSAIDAKVDANAGITGATKTKVTYDAKGLVTAGADATTADVADSLNKRYVTDAELTVLGNTSGTNTGDQTTVSGNAGTATKLAATKNIDGVAFDGSADITVIAPGTHAATSKTTPVDADELALVDSAASNVLKKVTWANVKATLKTYFDTLYLGAAASAGGDLTGTYPNPTVAALAITDAKVATANKDGTAATASMRTLGTGGAQAAAGNDSRLSDARTPTAHAASHKPGASDALLTVVRAHGTSASGTPGTSVASLAAAASNQLTALVINCAQTSATGTQFTITITYSDSTTTTLTSTAATAQTVLGNNDALILTTGGAFVSLTALSAKAITSVAVITAGTGVGTRGASIAANQVLL